MLRNHGIHIFDEIIRVLGRIFQSLDSIGRDVVLKGSPVFLHIHETVRRNSDAIPANKIPDELITLDCPERPHFKCHWRFAEPLSHFNDLDVIVCPIVRPDVDQLGMIKSLRVAQPPISLQHHRSQLVTKTGEVMDSLFGFPAHLETGDARCQRVIRVINIGKTLNTPEIRLSCCCSSLRFVYLPSLSGYDIVCRPAWSWYRRSVSSNSLSAVSVAVLPVLPVRVLL